MTAAECPASQSRSAGPPRGAPPTDPHHDPRSPTPDQCCWVDLAIGGVARRNRVVTLADVPSIIQREGRHEAYLTLYRFPVAYRDHCRDTHSVAGYAGPAYAWALPLDIDRPNRQEALDALRLLLGQLWSLHSLAAEDLWIWWSGNKGFHVLLPAPLFGGWQPSPTLPRLLKILAPLVARDVAIDTVIYDRNRLFRLPDSQHGQSGLWKVQLTPPEALHASLDEIQRIAAAGPRGVVHRPDPPEPVPSLVKLKAQAATVLRTQADGMPATADPRPADGSADTGTLPATHRCIHSILAAQPKRGERHNLALRLAAHWRAAAVPETSARQLLMRWSSRDPLPAREMDQLLRDVYRRGYDFGCRDPLRQRYCHPSCLIRRRREQRADATPDPQDEPHLETILAGHPDTWPLRAADTLAALARQELAAGREGPATYHDSVVLCPAVGHGVTLRPATGPDVVTWAAHLGWRAWRGDDGKRQPCSWSSRSRQAMLLSALRSRLPVIHRLDPAPMIGEDWTLSHRPGLHNGVFLATAQTLPDPPQGLRHDQVAIAAVRQLRQWLASVPFASDRDFAHAVASALSCFAGRAIPRPYPMVAILAPQPGTGKTTLLKALLCLATGAEPYLLPEVPRGRGADEEIQKMLLSVLLSGCRYVAFDNASSLESSSLAAWLTAARWRGRKLGSSTIAEHSLAGITTWVTGNRPATTPEMERRLLTIDLVPTSSDPASAFRTTPPDDILRDPEQELRLRGALWHLVWAWRESGRPGYQGRHAGFRQWAATIGGMLATAGLAHSFLVRPVVRQLLTDPQEALQTLVAEWWRTRRDQPVTTRDLCDPQVCQEQVADALAGRHITDHPTALGRLLARHVGQVFRVDDHLDVAIRRRRTGRTRSLMLVPVDRSL